MEAKPRLTRRIKRSHIVGQQSDGIPLYVSTTALRACFVRDLHPQNRHASKVGRHSTFMGGVSNTAIGRSEFIVASGGVKIGRFDLSLGLQANLPSMPILAN